MSSGAAATPADGVAGETLDAWRSRGADRIDPVRFCFIEAFARKTAAHGGAARRLLDARLAELLAAYGDLVARHENPRHAQAQAVTPAARGNGPLKEPRPRGPLAELLDSTLGPADPAPGGLPELKALRHFQATWHRLGAQQRLRDSRARAPSNAGPLNSHRLVHEALSLMQDVAPAYLHRFVAYVDALSWIDLAAGGDVRITPRAGPASRPGR
jgi:hypothetical protein